MDGRGEGGEDPGGSVRVDAAGVELHVRRAGPAGGPPVVCLHGFPEFWYAWRAQLPALAAAGYRVLAPDLRGYNRSAKPDRVHAYRIDRLAADVLAVLDALGHDRARVVGHDWGAMVAWWLGVEHPDRVARLVAANVPHPRAFARGLLDPRQLLRSWYTAFYQLPGVERLLGARDFALLERGLVDSARPGTFDGHRDRYRAAWAREGALRGMLGAYRAVGRAPWHLFGQAGRVEPPTLVVWGREDRSLRPALARDSLDYCAEGRLETLGATHWLHHERADAVNDLLVDFLDG